MPQVPEINEAATLTGRFYDIANALNDPDTVDLTLTKPDGTVVNVLQASLDNPSTGVWTYTFVPDQVGLWLYRFNGEGDPDVGGEQMFYVFPAGAFGAGELCETWASIDDVTLCGACTSADPGVLSRMLEVASEFLYVKSGRQWSGLCRETVRPCRQVVGVSAPWGESKVGYYTSASHAPMLVCGCGGDPYRGQCGCGTVAEIALPGAPVVAVTSITIDGDVVPASSWRVDDGRWLVRTDGEGWPSCQNMAADSGDGTFIVTYAYGARPPASGVAAASALACELTLACANSSDCRLPRRVTNVVREGITVGALLDDLDLFAKGRTGVAEVDMFLAWANPGNVIRPPEVFSPHLGPRARRTTVA